LKKDKLELEALRDQLKRFFDHDYKMTFILFPPMMKIANKSKKTAKKDNGEEAKNDDSNSDDEKEVA
jgi:hypothetical protein